MNLKFIGLIWLFVGVVIVYGVQSVDSAHKLDNINSIQVISAHELMLKEQLLPRLINKKTIMTIVESKKDSERIGIAKVKEKQILDKFINDSDVLQRAEIRKDTEIITIYGHIQLIQVEATIRRVIASEWGQDFDQDSEKKEDL